MRNMNFDIKIWSCVNIFASTKILQNIMKRLFLFLATSVVAIGAMAQIQVKAITVVGRGTTSEVIHGSELQAGLYIYSLVTDGKLVGSKQMILTE